MPSAGRTVLMLLAAGALDGCADNSTVEIGIVEYYRMAPTIDVPATASVDEPVPVHVVTYGGGCFMAEDTTVRTASNGVVVTPLDRRQLGVCTEQLLTFEHGTTVTFDSPGLQSVTIRGRHVAMNTDEIIDYTTTITVQYTPPVR